MVKIRTHINYYKSAYKMTGSHTQIENTLSSSKPRKSTHQRRNQKKLASPRSALLSPLYSAITPLEVIKASLELIHEAVKIGINLPDEVIAKIKFSFQFDDGSQDVVSIVSNNLSNAFYFGDDAKTGKYFQYLIDLGIMDKLFPHYASSKYEYKKSDTITAARMTAKVSNESDNILKSFYTNFLIVTDDNVSISHRDVISVNPLLDDVYGMLAQESALKKMYLHRSLAREHREIATTSENVNVWLRDKKLGYGRGRRNFELLIDADLIANLFPKMADAIIAEKEWLLSIFVLVDHRTWRTTLGNGLSNPGYLGYIYAHFLVAAYHHRRMTNKNDLNTLICENNLAYILFTALNLDPNSHKNLFETALKHYAEWPAHKELMSPKMKVIPGSTHFNFYQTPARPPAVKQNGEAVTHNAYHALSPSHGSED
jgi:hypothetical protein